MLALVIVVHTLFDKEGICAEFDANRASVATEVAAVTNGQVFRDRLLAELNLCIFCA